jgi:hypothetical protein
MDVLLYKHFCGEIEAKVEVDTTLYLSPPSVSDVDVSYYSLQVADSLAGHAVYAQTGKKWVRIQ